MKLYTAIYSLCGITILQTLTGLSWDTLIRMVMDVRKRNPRNSEGLRCSRKNMLPSVNHGVFFSEVVEIINKRKICKKRVISQYDLQFSKNVVQFAKTFKVGTYLVLIRSHFLVVRDGLTYDNQGWAYLPSNHPFWYDKVEAYAVLDPNRTPDEVIDKGH